MKFVLSIAVPALLLCAAPAIAQNLDPSSPAAQAAQTPGGKTDPSIAAPTGGIQGSTTGAARMNGPMGNGQPVNGASNSMSSGSVSADNSASSSSTNLASNSSSSSSVGASVDSAPTYQGGRAGYRGKSRSSLDQSEAQITAQLNQQAAQ